jgi:DNA polymerase I-like protein with 3'-5' exonuclease and polymerase domains
MSSTLDHQYPNVPRWANLMHEEAVQRYCLSTAISGRVRRWPLGNAAATECANHPIQGTAADIMNLATFRIVDRLKRENLYQTRAWIILQIHDALYVECEDEVVEQVKLVIDEEMPYEMTYTSPVTGETNTMRFPVETKIGKRLSEV